MVVGSSALATQPELVRVCSSKNRYFSWCNWELQRCGFTVDSPVHDQSDRFRDP